MTAEIAIMNKMGVALATDSAITIGDRAKFYNTANKLFMLSKFHPVGIMIYNQADFMGIPWEVIIKEYRSKLKDDQKERLEDYGTDFISFLTSSIFDYSSYDEQYYKNMTLSLIFEIKDNIDKKLNEHFLSKKQLPTETEIKQIANETVTFYEILFARQVDLPAIPSNYLVEILKKYDAILSQQIMSLIPVISSCLDRVKVLCNKLFVLDNFVKNYSGIVIAGFGKADFFPQLISYKISGFFHNFLKYKKVQQESISNTPNKDYQIIPFAQTDVVQTFLHGINDNYIDILLKNFNDNIIKEFDNLDDNLFDNNGKIVLKQIVDQKLKETINGLIDYSKTQYYVPVLLAIRVLPIDELALMAESLVNLTSFRRQVSFDKNTYTVGGPIDVAVISKGDGFVWIKRKHYFKPEYNHHFFNNYFKDQTNIVVKEEGDINDNIE